MPGVRAPCVCERPIPLSISASVACSTVPTEPMPALLTRTSHRRPSVQIASKHALTRLATVTSHMWPVHFQPLRLHPSTAVLIAGAARSRMWTSAPAAPKASAIARPIPLAPPVTMAVLPDSEKGMRSRVGERSGSAVVAVLGTTRLAEIRITSSARNYYCNLRECHHVVCELLRV